MVEILDYDCQILQDNKEKEIKKRKDEEKQRKKNKTKMKKSKGLKGPSAEETKLTELINAKMRELDDKKELANNGRLKLQSDYANITRSAEENVSVF
jgi:hypothetical protein